MAGKFKIFGTHKKCSNCTVEKEINESNFYIDSRAEKLGRHKYTAQCKDCLSKKKAEYNKKYLKKREVLDRKNQTARIRYKNNPNKYKQLNLNYKNRDYQRYLNNRKIVSNKRTENIEYSYLNERLKSFFGTAEIKDELKETYIINLKLKRECRTLVI